jgi:hypothetical protein
MSEERLREVKDSLRKYVCEMLQSMSAAFMKTLEVQF